MSFYDGPRDPASPFFMARDRRRPYTYTAAMADLKTMLLRVGTDAAYGLHGLRVEGYNCSKEENGEELTVAHGGWQAGSNSRYDRFKLYRVLNIAAGMVGEDGAYSDNAAVRPRQIQRATLVRGTGEAAPPPVEEERVEVADEEHGGVQHVVLEEAQAARASSSSAFPDSETLHPTSDAAPPGWSVDDDGFFDPPAPLVDLGAVRTPTAAAAWRVHRVATSLADTAEYVAR